MATKKTKRQTTPTQPASGQKSEASGFLMTDPSQDEQQIQNALTRSEPTLSPEESKALIRKATRTSAAGRASAPSSAFDHPFGPLSQAEIQRLQERHPGLSAEAAIRMAREFGF